MALNRGIQKYKPRQLPNSKTLSPPKRIEINNRMIAHFLSIRLAAQDGPFVIMRPARAQCVLSIHRLIVSLPNFANLFQIQSHIRCPMTEAAVGVYRSNPFVENAASEARQQLVRPDHSANWRDRVNRGLDTK